MTIKEAFEYLSSECGIGMKNPFIALRNLVEAFGKVADEVDPTPSEDFVKKSGDTMTGDLTVEGDIDCTGSDMYCNVLHPIMIQFNSPLSETSAIDLIGRPTGVGGVQIEVPYKNGTMALTKDIAAYSTEERLVGTWIDGSRVYRKVVEFEETLSIANTAFTSTGIDASSMSMILNVRGIYTGGISTYDLIATIENNEIKVQSSRNNTGVSVKYLILEYVKPTI